MKKLIAQIISVLMPTQSLRRNVRDYILAKTSNHGKNNKIVYVDKKQKKHIVHKLPGCRIHFRGDNNYVEVHGPLNLLRLNATLCGESKIIIQSSKFASRDFKIESMTNCSLHIGKDCYVNGAVRIEFAENTNVHIGDNCMFSYDIIIRTGDGHPITSLKTGERINPNQDIFIGHRVWIAARAIILKGSVISDNSIVGAGSVCNKKFYDTNVVIAGSPACIKKRDINWQMG